MSKALFLAMLTAFSGAAMAQSGRMESDAGVASLLAVAKADFDRIQPGARIERAMTSGTTRALDRFCRGEIGVIGAAREARIAERGECANRKVAFIELLVGHDAVAIVVNPGNTWARQIDIAGLRRAWMDAQGKATHWNQLNAAWPSSPLKLYGPGPTLGLAGHSRAVLAEGSTRLMRRDMNASESLSVVADGVARDLGALGMVDWATYAANAKRLRLLPVDGAGEALTFPLYLYVSDTTRGNPGLRAYLDYLLANGVRFAGEAGVRPLSEQAYQDARKRLAEQK